MVAHNQFIENYENQNYEDISKQITDSTLVYLGKKVMGSAVCLVRLHVDLFRF